MRRASKTDANQRRIVEALRQAGCSVQPLHHVGQGCPDILVGVRGHNLLMEIKDGRKPPSKRRKTADQETWHGRWRGQVAVVKNVDEAIELVNGVVISGAW